MLGHGLFMGEAAGALGDQAQALLEGLQCLGQAVGGRQPLAAAQRPGVARALGLERHASGFPRIARVEQGQGSDRLAAREFRQPARTVGFAADVQDGVGGQRDAGEIGRAEHRAAHLFEDDAQFEETEPLAAVFFRDVNALQANQMIDRILQRFDGTLEGKTIAVWGLAFKAQTDDVRESPAHTVMKGLLAAGASINAFDPEAMETTRISLGSLADKIEFATGPYSAIEGADALVVCTEWSVFREPNLSKLYARMRRPRVFDGRNLYDPQTMAQAGFEYFSVGRPSFPARLRSSATNQEIHWHHDIAI